MLYVHPISTDGKEPFFKFSATILYSGVKHLQINCPEHVFILLSEKKIRSKIKNYITKTFHKKITY